MKHLSRLLSTAAVASVSMWAPQAFADQICNGCNYLSGPTYVGVYNSTTFDFGSVIHSTSNIANPLVAGAFTDTYVFDFTPAGSTSVNAQFIPSGAFSSFAISLAPVTGGSCPALSGALPHSAGSLCSGITVGGPLGSATAGGAVTAANINYIPLVAGLYAFVVSGNFSGQAGSNYQGQITTTPVPEPGSLALVGLALFGLAATARKRSS